MESERILSSEKLLRKDNDRQGSVARKRKDVKGLGAKKN
jgi:hypothetical protein